MTDTEHAYENDAYQSDDIDDNEIIILYLGWKRAGKTTIKEVFFEITNENFSWKRRFQALCAQRAHEG